MPFFSKPAHALCSLLFLLQVVTFAAGYKIDPKSCSGKYKAQVQDAMKEIVDIVTYADKRAATRSPYKRQGTLLQDLLDASSEDDAYVLRQVSSAMAGVKRTINENDVIIHCDDKHLTPTTGRKDLYYDNSNGRQARVQVLNVAGRGSTACGGVQRAFEYEFNNAKTGRIGGKAIVLCSDSAGALKAADERGLGFWRDKNLLTISAGVDFFSRFLSYMILHELMHASDRSSFPVNPGGQAELYGYQKITGHAVGKTGHGGPNSRIRLHNADSYALLACGWYMRNFYFTNGKFTLTPSKQRPPITLRRRFPELEARDPKGKAPKKTSKKPAPATSAVPAPASSAAAPASSAPAPSPPASKSSAAPKSSVSKSSITSTSSGTHTTSSSSTRSSSSSKLPPIFTAIGDAATKFPKIVIPGAILAAAAADLLPYEFGSDNSTSNSTVIPSGTAPITSLALTATAVPSGAVNITSLASITAGIPSSGFVTSILTTSDACNGTKGTKK